MSGQEIPGLVGADGQDDVCIVTLNKDTSVEKSEQSHTDSEQKPPEAPKDPQLLDNCQDFNMHEESIVGFKSPWLDDPGEGAYRSLQHDGGQHCDDAEGRDTLNKNECKETNTLHSTDYSTSCGDKPKARPDLDDSYSCGHNRQNEISEDKDLDDEIKTCFECLSDTVPDYEEDWVGYIMEDVNDADSVTLQDKDNEPCFTTISEGALGCDSDDSYEAESTPSRNDEGNFSCYFCGIILASSGEGRVRLGDHSVCASSKPQSTSGNAIFCLGCFLRRRDTPFAEDLKNNEISLEGGKISFLEEATRKSPVKGGELAKIWKTIPPALNLQPLMTC